MTEATPAGDQTVQTPDYSSYRLELFRADPLSTALVSRDFNQRFSLVATPLVLVALTVIAALLQGTLGELGLIVEGLKDAWSIVTRNKRDPPSELPLLRDVFALIGIVALSVQTANVYRQWRTLEVVAVNLLRHRAVIHRNVGQPNPEALSALGAEIQKANRAFKRIGEFGIVAASLGFSVSMFLLSALTNNGVHAIIFGQSESESVFEGWWANPSSTVSSLAFFGFGFWVAYYILLQQATGLRTVLLIARVTHEWDSWKFGIPNPRSFRKHSVLSYRLRPGNSDTHGWGPICDGSLTIATAAQASAIGLVSLFLVTGPANSVRLVGAFLVWGVMNPLFIIAAKVFFYPHLKSHRDEKLADLQSREDLDHQSIEMWSKTSPWPRKWQLAHMFRWVIFYLVPLASVVSLFQT